MPLQLSVEGAPALRGHMQQLARQVLANNMCERELGMVSLQSLCLSYRHLA